MDDRTLVVVFLRGGLDGLGAVVPYEDDDYHRARPVLRQRPPGRGDASRLDERFALHAGLSALRPLYDAGRLAIFHAIGSDDSTRSHFEAQDQMERGASEQRPLAGGWIARWLRAAKEDGALAAVAFGDKLPESLRGATSACAVSSLADLEVSTRSGDGAGFAAALASLHADGGPAATALVRRRGRDALSLLDRVEELRRDGAGLGGFPDTAFARSMSQVVQLVRAGVGLRAAAVDHGGFDTHFGQALTLASELREFAEGLDAFDRALGSDRDRVTTVCVTEFGRTLSENSSFGTDHGRGSCAFVLGGGVAGGRVVADWPGLDDASLADERDLRVTTDYRDLLGEVLARRFGLADPSAVFPGHAFRTLGVVA
jgi:uncharacterized protein (DUF1501 family)